MLIFQTYMKKVSCDIRVCFNVKYTKQTFNSVGRNKYPYPTINNKAGDFGRLSKKGISVFTIGL